MLKKLLFSLTLFAFLFSSLISPFAKAALAQSPGDASTDTGAPEQNTWFNQDFNTWADKVYNPDNPDEIFGERYTAAQVQWIIYGVISFILNSSFDPDVMWCAARAVTESSSSPSEQGIIWSTIDELWDLFEAAGCGVHFTNLFEQAKLFFEGLIQRVTSDSGRSSPFAFAFTRNYFSNVASNLHIIPEAKAQGFGFTAVNIVQGLWQVSRNVSYFLLVLMTIVMAFMIMFRMKISPQTVVTVQSAIPKLIIALVLITFSYAIAGLLIDLMYVALGLVTTILTNDTTGILEAGTTWSSLWSNFTDRGLIYWFSSYWIRFGSSAVIAISGMDMIVRQVMTTVSIGWILELLMFVVLALVLLKTIFFLLKNYFSIIMQIAFAPFFILFNIGGGIGGWIRGLAANLAVYPVVAVMLVFAFLFLEPSTPTDWRSLEGFTQLITSFNLQFNHTLLGVGNEWDPPFGWGTQFTGLVFLAASIMVISFIPKIVDIIFQNVLRQVLGLAAIIVFLYILFAGFKYITAGESPDQVAAARKQITYAIGGLVVIAASYLILTIIQTLTGANVTNFTVGQ